MLREFLGDVVVDEDDVDDPTMSFLTPTVCRPFVDVDRRYDNDALS